MRYGMSMACHMDILGITFRAALLKEEIESAANNAPFPMLIIEYSKKDSNQSFSHIYVSLLLLQQPMALPALH